MPYCLTIQQTEATDQIIFIGFDGNVRTDVFPFQASTDFFDHQGFAVTRKTCDKHRIKDPRFQDFFQNVEITPSNIPFKLLRHITILFFHHTNGRRSHLNNSFRNSRTNLGRYGSRSILNGHNFVNLATIIRKMKQPTIFFQRITFNEPLRI